MIESLQILVALGGTEEVLSVIILCAVLGCVRKLKFFCGRSQKIGLTIGSGREKMGLKVGEG